MEADLGITLLDKAKESSSSDYKTAKMLGVTPQIVSDWRHGRRKPQPEDMALLAAIAGMDPEAWLVRAVLEKHAGTKKGEKLFTALGKERPATGAGSGGFLRSSVKGRCGRPESDVPRCVVWLTNRSKRRKGQTALFF